VKRRFAESSEVQQWFDDVPANVRVRGPNYLVDRVKQQSKSAMLELVDVDLFLSATDVIQYTSRPGNLVQQLRNQGDTRVLVVLQMRFPDIFLVGIWAVPENADWHHKPEGRLFDLFRYGSDEERSRRFKLIPRVTDMPAWVIGKALPEKPAIIPKKMVTHFFTSKDYLEMSVNVLSAPGARHVVGLFKPLARFIAVRLHVVIEGLKRDELPERILCGLEVGNIEVSQLPCR